MYMYQLCHIPSQDAIENDRKCVCVLGGGGGGGG